MRGRDRIAVAWSESWSCAVSHVSCLSYPPCQRSNGDNSSRREISSNGRGIWIRACIFWYFPPRCSASLQFLRAFWAGFRKHPFHLQIDIGICLAARDSTSPETWRRLFPIEGLQNRRNDEWVFWIGREAGLLPIFWLFGSIQTWLLICNTRDLLWEFVLFRRRCRRVPILHGDRHQILATVHYLFSAPAPITLIW